MDPINSNSFSTLSVSSLRIKVTEKERDANHCSDSEILSTSDARFNRGDYFSSLSVTDRIRHRNAFKKNPGKETDENLSYRRTKIANELLITCQVKNYDRVMRNYLTFFKRLSDALNNFSHYVDEVKDNKIQIKAQAFAETLRGLLEEYKNKILYPETGVTISKQEAENIVKILGLPEECVVANNCGGYDVKYDVSLIENNLAVIPNNGESVVTLPCAKYYFWAIDISEQRTRINNYINACDLSNENISSNTVSTDIHIEAMKRFARIDYFDQSSRDFCNDIAKIIGEIKGDYLENYENALERYVTFFQKVSDILSRLPGYIGSTDNDNKISLWSEALTEEFTTLLNEYQNKRLYPADDEVGITREEAEDWAKKLGISEEYITLDLSGHYYIRFDTSPITAIIDSIPKGPGGFVILTTIKYQAWKAGFDAQIEKINNYMQTLSQKYTTANNTYDNLVKILSSTISSMYDTDKEFLKN